MSGVSAYHGGCHCGALRVTFESARAPAEVDRRACQCSFCRAHGAITMSDADGAMRVDAEESALVRYRFGLKTADFLICARCGIYVGAVFFEDDEAWAIVNANALDERGSFTAPVNVVSYDGETPGSRGERRKTRWTPLLAFNVA
jgi:hypothetical protein